MAETFEELFAEEPKFQFDWKPVVVFIILAITIVSLIKSVL
jgi:hypothetical protein